MKTQLTQYMTKSQALTFKKKTEKKTLSNRSRTAKNGSCLFILCHMAAPVGGRTSINCPVKVGFKHSKQRPRWLWTRLTVWTTEFEVGCSVGFHKVGPAQINATCGALLCYRLELLSRGAVLISSFERNKVCQLNMQKKTTCHTTWSISVFTIQQALM